MPVIINEVVAELEPLAAAAVTEPFEELGALAKAEHDLAEKLALLAERRDRLAID